MKKYDIVGIYHPSPYDSNTVILSDSLYELFEDYVEDTYSYTIAPLTGTRTAQKRLVVFGYSEFDNVRYPLKNIATDVSNMKETMESFTIMFLAIGIVFVLFAALILFNFLSVSISNRKRNIGILRAMGAREKDVFFIFFNESFLIIIMNFILSIILCLIGAFALNKFFQSYTGFLLSFIVFGIRQVLIIFAINIFIAFLASFLPVYKICRMKPIDAIRK